MIIKIPKVLDDVGAITTINEIERNRDCSDMAYQFSEIDFVFPFGTILLAEKIRNISLYRHRKSIPNRILEGNTIKETSVGAIGYLKFFGFFKYIGTTIGYDYNRQIRKSNYTPIQKITLDSLTMVIGKNHWTESIEDRCEQIASIVSKDIQTNIQLSYCFREIIRNVFEHSNSDSCTVMAQLYSSTKMVEICIADNGIGIANSLRKIYPQKNKVEILEKALLPGVSSKPTNIEHNKWGNTGFGLYTLSELGKKYGEFSIISNGSYLKFYEHDKKVLIDSVAYNGTVIKLRISLKDVDYFPNILKQIIETGEDLTEVLFGRRIKASGMSKKSGSI